MPRSGRGYFLAAGLAALLGLGVSGGILWDAWRSQTYYEQQADKAAQAARDSGTIHAQRACALVSLAERAECQADEYNDARERERNEYDLQAQLVMATWTRAMGLAALIATFTGIVGVGLVYATFAETRESNAIARRSAEAAADEARAAKDAYVLAQRAVISIRRVWFQEIGARDRFWPIAFEVQNDGRSNAHKFRLDYAISSKPVWSWTLSESCNRDVLCRPDGGTIGLDFRIRAPQEFPAYLIGYISYRTVHDAMFKTYFCREITGRPDEQNSYGELLHLNPRPHDCKNMPRDT